jgi:hypothetical protein
MHSDALRILVKVLHGIGGTKSSDTCQCARQPHSQHEATESTVRSGIIGIPLQELGVQSTIRTRANATPRPLQYAGPSPNAGRSFPIVLF